MSNMLPEIEAEMNAHLEAVAQILRQHTEPEKLQDFESIEIEVRKQVQEEVTPKIGEFFFRKGARKELSASMCEGSPVEVRIDYNLCNEWIL